MTGRDSKGRYVKGYSGNSQGRPRRQKAEYLNAISDVVTLDKWTKIIERAVADAIKGNATARKWLSDYTLGRPVEHVVADVVTVPMTLSEWTTQAEERRREVDEC